MNSQLCRVTVWAGASCLSLFKHLWSATRQLDSFMSASWWVAAAFDRGHWAVRLVLQRANPGPFPWRQPGGRKREHFSSFACAACEGLVRDVMRPGSEGEEEWVAAFSRLPRQGCRTRLRIPHGEWGGVRVQPGRPGVCSLGAKFMRNLRSQRQTASTMKEANLRRSC